MSINRRIDNAAAALEYMEKALKDVVTSQQFSPNSTAYHMGYYQAHKDLMHRLRHFRNKQGDT